MTLILTLDSSSLPLASLKECVDKTPSLNKSKIVAAGTRENFSGEVESYMVIAVSIVGNLALNVIASAIYDLVKSGVVRVRAKGRIIDGENVASVEEQIENISNG